jgi:hypothetical protein
MPNALLQEPSVINPILPLENMAVRHPGLTSALAESYLEAARVCLDRHHKPPQQFQLTDEVSNTAIQVEWKSTDAQCQAAWANRDDATRDGAYACALAATELCKGFVAIRRAETKTGADYYIAPLGEDFEDLENWFRLEVSGTDQGTFAEVKRRLAIKIDQAKNGKSNLPAIAAVVGFKAQSIVIQTVE